MILSIDSNVLHCSNDIYRVATRYIVDSEEEALAIEEQFMAEQYLDVRTSGIHHVGIYPREYQFDIYHKLRSTMEFVVEIIFYFNSNEEIVA